MPIDVSCPCGSIISVGDHFAGKSGRCRRCGKRLVIPYPKSGQALVPTVEPASFPSSTEMSPRAIKAEVHRPRSKACGSPLFVIQVGRGGIRYHRNNVDIDRDIKTFVRSDANDLVNAIHSASLVQGTAGAFFGVFCIAATVAVLFGVSASYLAGSVAGVVALIAIAYWPHAAWKDQHKKSVRAYYDLDAVGSAFQESSTSIAGALSRVGALWSVNSEAFTSDWKRNAGANSLVTRQRATSSLSVPKCVITNARVGMIGVGTTKIYFFPDQVLVQRPLSIEAWQYSELLATAGSIRFIESDTLPHDAHVIDYTWQYVNKNGSPDRRFANNRQFPVAMYGTLELGPHGKRQLTLQVSSVQAASGAAKLIELVQKANLEIRSTSSHVQPPPISVPELSPNTHPYAALVEKFTSGYSLFRSVISLRWFKRLPDWMQPIAVGSVLSVPAVVLLLLVFGRSDPKVIEVLTPTVATFARTEPRIEARSEARSLVQAHPALPMPDPVTAPPAEVEPVEDLAKNSPVLNPLPGRGPLASASTVRTPRLTRPLEQYQSSVSTSSDSGGTVHVRGYYRRNGTYVAPHTRSAPHSRRR